MNVNEIMNRIVNKEQVTWGEVKDTLSSEINVIPENGAFGTIPVTFNNCPLTVNGTINSDGEIVIEDSAVLYNPMV